MTADELSRIERLLAYALIFEAPRYDPVSGSRLPLSDADKCAAEALRFYAAHLKGAAATEQV